MISNAEQMKAAADLWAVMLYGPGGDRLWSDVGDGPYHLVVAPTTGLDQYYGQRQTLAVFEGAQITYLDQETLSVVAGQMTLHTVPHKVFLECGLGKISPGWRAGQDANLNTGVGQFTFFDELPVEADLASVFVAAMSARGEASRGRGADGLGDAIAGACGQLGWRTVARLVAAMGAGTLRRPQDVIAVLEAVRSVPALLH